MATLEPTLVWCAYEQAPSWTRDGVCPDCGATDHQPGDGSHYPFAYLDLTGPPARYVMCSTCSYEKVAGSPCGLPCA